MKDLVQIFVLDRPHIHVRLFQGGGWGPGAVRAVGAGTDVLVESRVCVTSLLFAAEGRVEVVEIHASGVEIGQVGLVRELGHEGRFQALGVQRAEIESTELCACECV